MIQAQEDHKTRVPTRQYERRAGGVDGAVDPVEASILKGVWLGVDVKVRAIPAVRPDDDGTTRTVGHHDGAA